MDEARAADLDGAQWKLAVTAYVVAASSNVACCVAVDFGDKQL